MLDEEIIFQPSGEKIKVSEIKRNNFFLYLFFFVFFVSLIYFLYLQIFLKKDLLVTQEKIRKVVYFSFPPRGNVYDQKGNLLVTSEQSFDVYLDLEKLPPEIDLRSLIQKGQFFYRGNQLIVRDVPKDLAFNLMTQKLDFLKVIPSFKRKYLIGEELGNLIGYVGFPDEKEKDYPSEEFIGKSGLELSYQDYLRGKPGEIVYQKTKSGLKKIKETLPSPGQSLVLTLDYQFQKRAYELMAQYFQKHGYQSGALVALNPHNGEIIALISYPSFDPKWYFEKREKFLQALKDKNKPFFNRVIGGLYVPGSTIKLIVAVGALEEKIVTPETKIYADGELKIPHPYFPGVYSIFRDNKVHGWTDIYQAIADSVNIYFYVVGGGYPYEDEKIPVKKGLGIYNLIKYWRLFGLGQKSGLDLMGEKEGFLPSPETKRKNFLDPIWRLGDTYNVSIGQGDLLVTPLQIALWTSAFVNNKIYQPYLVKKILDENNQVIFERKPKLWRENLMSEETLKVIQKAMRRTVTQGTAKILRDLPVAGKSGTPEIFGKKKLNAIFTGYFPYDQPEIVMTLLIENVPHGAVATLPLYRELVKTYLELNHGRNSF